MIKYYILDTETTGLKAGYHEINQISVIRREDGFQKTINIAVAFPDRADAKALQIQNKTKFDLKKGIVSKEAAEILNEFLNEDGLNSASRCIVGHNISFDRRHIHAMYDILQMEFCADLWLCTKQMANRYAKKIGLTKFAAAQQEQKPRYSLDACCRGAGVVAKFGAHSATIDCQNNIKLFDFYMNQNLDYVRLIQNHEHKKKHSGSFEYYDDFE